MTDVDSHRDAVLTRVRECLRMCVGDSGHLYGYTIDPETFEITDSVPSNGSTEYAFRVDGRRDDEFTEAGYAEQESIEGTIVLDRDLDLTFDTGGRVQLEPHTPVHPRFWGRTPAWAAAGEVDPPDDGLLDLAVPELAAGAYNPVWWRPSGGDAVAADVDRLLGVRGESVVLIARDVTDETAGFDEAMTAVARALETDHEVTVIDEQLETTRAVFRRTEEDTP